MVLTGRKNHPRREQAKLAPLGQPLKPLTADEVKSGCEKVLDAVRQNDVKKLKRFLNRYVAGITKVCTAAGADGWSAVTSAADLGHVDALRMMTESDVPVHWADGHGWLALHAAVFQDRLEMVSFLLDEVKTNVDYRSRSGWTALHVASRHSDANVVQLLVANRADVNAAGHRKWTPLHLAAAEGRSEVVEVMLSGPIQADATLLTESGATPLYVAAQNGHDGVVQMLIEFNADTIRATQADGWAPIHAAASNGHDSVVGVLLRADVTLADLRTASAGGETPLYLAAQNGHTAVVTQLLDRAADVELASTERAWSALAVACARGQTAVVRLLRTRGQARLDAVTGDGETTLYLAAAGNYRDVVRELLDDGKGVDINIPNIDGQRALFAAARCDSADVLEALLAAGSDITARDYDGRTVLHAAVRDNRVSVVKRLLAETKGRKLVGVGDRHGATPVHVAAQYGAVDCLVTLKMAGGKMNTRTNDGRTPVFLAAQSGQKKVLEQLIDYLADVNLCESHRWAPLHAACAPGYLDIVDMLINAGADVNWPGEQDTSCLYLAVYNGHRDIVSRLLDAEAEVNVRTGAGWTVLHACAEKGYVDIASRLIDAGTDPAILSKTGDTPLHTAARWGNASFIELVVDRCPAAVRSLVGRLLDGRPDLVDVEGSEGWTALHWAAAGGRDGVVETLLDAGADVERVTEKGCTALHLAVRCGHQDVVEALVERGGANVNVADAEGLTPYQIADDRRLTQIRELLVKCGADVQI